MGAGGKRSDEVVEGVAQRLTDAWQTLGHTDESQHDRKDGEEDQRVGHGV